MPPTWPQYFAIFLSFLAFVLALMSLRAATLAYRQASIRSVKVKSLKRLSSIESELTEIVDSVSTLHDSMKKLRSRIGMRNLRSKPNGADTDLPDPRTDPDGWKRAMRLRLHHPQRK